MPVRTMENTNHTYANVLSSCPEGPVDSGIIYLHSISSQRITDNFKIQFDIFVTLHRASGHRPTTALLVSNMWSHKESEASVIERMKVSEHHFKNTITLSYAQFHLQFALMEVE